MSSSNRKTNRAPDGAANGASNGAQNGARERLLLLASAQPSPTRDQATRVSRALYALAIATILIVFQAAGGVAHSRGRPLGFTLGIAAGAIVLALLASAVAFARGRGMAGPPRGVLASVAFAVPVLTVVWLVSWSDRYSEPFQRIGWRCLGLTLVLGGALLAAIVLVSRRKVATTPIASGAAFGAVAGAWAAVGVDLWCPLSKLAHATIGHAIPLVLLIAIGATLGHVTLRTRAD